MVGQNTNMAIENGENRYEGRTTIYVVVTTLVSSATIMCLGYDTGITGGVIAMDSFLEDLFPTIYRERRNKNNYCGYNNQTLQLFTSSLYLAAVCSCLLASYTTRVWGRRRTLLFGAVLFATGTILNVAAQNVTMLIIGRLLQGAALGFGLQAAPLYGAEMSPAQTRGAIISSVEVWFTIGLFLAGFINYRAARIKPWGWRLSLGLAGVPGLIWLTGVLFLPDTPASIIQRGQSEKARRLLEKIRGTPNVDAEYKDIVLAVDRAAQVQSPFRTLLQTRYRPQLTVALFLPPFFQFTGTNAVNFYAPVLFRSLGFGNDASLYSTASVGGVKVLASFVAIPLVDRWGRKALLYQGGVQMFISLITVGALLQHNLDLQDPISADVAIGTVVIICVFVSAFSWSWGPLAFVISSEIFPLEIRPAGMSMFTALYNLFGFVMAQSFLTMLCTLRYGVFYFFACCLIVMTLFVAIFVPETKRVGVERMTQVWEQHWFWKRIVPKGTDVHPAVVNNM